MIFVTVGTHEQPFDRLVREVDRLTQTGAIREEVVMQTGYCTYEPAACRWSRFYTYAQMHDYISQARIVITHGGPSSFILPLQMGKVPIVVPRRKELGEHVNNHQPEFCLALARRNREILVAEHVADLQGLLENYDRLCAAISIQDRQNNAQFCLQFARIAEQLTTEDKKKRML